MTLQSNLSRYWVLGGRWVDDARHLPWPQVFGPYPDYRAAQAIADELSTCSTPDRRYLVVADVVEPCSG